MKDQVKTIEIHGLTENQKRDHVRRVVSSAKGTMVGIRNTKKDGSERIWNCRTGVKKHLKGGFSTIAGKAALMGVWEPKSRDVEEGDAGYRTVNLDTVIEVNTGGIKYLYK